MGNHHHLPFLFCLFYLFVLNTEGVNQKHIPVQHGFNVWNPRAEHITYCDFNNNSKPFCDWKQHHGDQDQGDWIRAKYSTPTSGTGPDGDYPDGNGYYVYQEATNLIPFDSIRLESPSIGISGDVCVDFWFHMSGSENLNELRVLIREDTGESVLWRRRGHQSPSWLYGSVTVSFPSEKNIQVIFEAIRGLTEYGDTAIDNVGVKNGPCDPTASSAASTTRSSTPKPPTSSTTYHPDECTGNLNCSFDDDFCNWKQSSSDTMDWIRLKGPTPSDSTGPSYDHTTGDGFYIYIDGRDSLSGDVALLLSPQCNLSRTHCFRFWYHMYGDAEMMELKVYALTDEGVELVSILAGNAGDRWHLEEVLILNTGNIQIIIEGVRGENDRSDIAIDDVSFVPGYCINSIISTTARTREPIPASTSYPATSGPTALPPHSTNVPTTAPSTTTATYPPGLGSTISNPTGTLGTTKASSTTTTIYPPSPDSTRTFPTIQSSTTSSPVTLPSAGSCVVDGDPHYNTFDHQVHHFMGTCTYTLSKLCGTDGHLTDFNVEAANEHRGGNTKVSYVTYVNVDVHGHRITLGKNRHVKVDGESVTLPISLSPGVNIFLSGRNVLVTTAFDLSVQFDGNHKVVVTLPGNYSRKVCGICGNFNGNAADDFLNPDGELEPDSASLGNSWQVGNDTRCSPGTDHTPDCTDDEKDTIVSNSFCGIITDTNGPFIHCHNVIDPTAYFNNCVYDLCVLHLDPDSLCDSLQSYVDSCQSHGVTVAPWRNDTFCPLQCPPNSHYEQCGTGCPATCVNQGSPSTCTRPCAEGCVCDPGYVLYDNTCVQSNQCGCWKDDKHYPVGSEFWTDDTCSSKCTCPSAGGSLVCNSASCPSDQYCGISNGVPGCYFDTYGFCRVHNDPHYDTFDRQNHHFMGLCTYTLAKLCANSSSLPYFNIEAKNEHRGNPSVSFVEKVFVDVYGQKVQIVRNEQNRVLVNQIWTTLPVTLLGGAVKVSWTGKYVSLDTDFKLRVSYDTDSSVEVKVHSTFSKQTCGICGNFNNRKQDDYMMPNGQQAQNSDELAHSWIVDDGDPLCNTDDSEPMPLPPCSPEKEDLYKNDTFCGLLTSKDGPFHMCHSVINPEGFFDSCVFDLCALDGDVGILCSLLAAYADTCQKQGVTLNWRDSTLCEPKCPLNSHYNACMTACPITCLEPLAPENCSNPCSEGCECDEGYVISGGTCVSKSHCGCWYNNTYYDEGESFLEENCENRCECKGSNTMVCTAVSCAADEICKVQSGTLGCYPLSTAICHIYGDPHYNTFDGRLHHFQGSCNYTVTETCGNTSDSFIVTTRNEHRGNPSWTAINSVALTVGGVHILLGKNNIVSITNASVTLPANVPGINIMHSGHYVIVTTDFGLQLQFNGDHELFVRVKENYKGTLCGLCGNYNDNQQDDFMQPNGTVVSDVNDFGNSWRVPDNGWPCESAPPPPTCSPSLQQEAEDKCRIVKLVNSPFRPCHIYINPHQYFESCIFDHCATGGNDNQTCAVLESYAAACEEIGVSLGDWRYGTICGSTNSATTVTPDLTAPSTTVTYPPSPDPTASAAASTTRSSTPEPATSSTADHPDECSGNLNCSFDDDFCNWKQSSSDNMDWIRLKGPTPSDSTGPSYDHTTGDGFYIYIDGRDSLSGDVALLLSPQCNISRTHCFRFWYHMYGDAEMMELKVYALTDEGVELVSILAGNAGDRWHLEEVLILNTGNIQIIIEGVRGENDRSDIAIDDVSFVPGYCINSIISTTARTREPIPASTSYPATSGPTALPPHSTNVPTTAPSTTTATYPPGLGSTISNPTGTLGTTKASSTTTTIYPPSPDSTRTFPTIQSSTTSSPVTFPSAGSCVVQGDPHYNTFDHQVHHFMGTCTYTLSKLCGTDGHLTDFNVEAANEHRGGNTKVSYVTYVNVDVHGHRITLGKNRHVKVDGESVTLPISLSPGVNIFLSGRNVLVTTAFDLSVQFDGNHKVVVTLPGNYSRKVCGICGNFNGNAADDFLNPDGELEPDSASLGNSWQVGNDTRCSPGTDHTPDCTDDEKDTIVSNSFCGIITDTNGPFIHCHNVIDPTAYFNNCVYDLCVLHLDPDSLCDSLQSYVDSCQSHGVTVAPWRNDTFCPLQCPPNSHYEQCGTGCPATCVNQGSPSTCTRPCAEGCVCDPGYVLYDNTCVQSNQCGCWKDDKHYPVGSEFWTDDTCSSKCTCPSAGGSLVCNSASCPSNQYCGISNGVPGCYFDTYGFCRVHNDPHYDTFDRQNHHFMGLCTYTLAKLCANSSSLPYFNIEAKNEHRGNPSVSFVEKVFVDVYGQKVQIVRNEQNRVLVNQIWTTLPVTLLGGAVKVSWTGKYVSLDTDFKLRVSYDTDSSVEVKVHSTFSKQTCGICGNFNNRKQDDYMMPNGQQAQNSDELAHSWIVDDSDPLCNTDDSEPMPLPPCSPEKEDLYKNDTFCGLLTSKDGPFHMCHSVINPEGFFDSCVFDLCALDGDVGILCSLLAAYADACQKQGVTLNWRDSTLCEPKCPLNSHYNACMTACPITCLEPLAPENCSNPCSEGCECDEGYVISGGTCVSKSHCGCWYNNTYYDEGESFLEENCENRCECKGSNTMVCTAVSCAADEICKVQSGTLGCYPLSTAICHIYGDPHYNTFDGRLHHFQGSCNYTVTETCGNTSDSFIVTTRNEHRGNPSWTAINSVALTVGGVHILLGKNNIVSITNASVTLPANVPGINIMHSGHYVIVTTDFGLQLQFNGDHELFVRVKENYKGTLCGLCGNYNDNQQDDFMQPNGTVVSDVNDFGNSWRVPDNGWPCESAPPPPPTCSPSLQQEAEDKCRIVKLVNSPFRPCHIYINPHQYFESCIFDHCATGGNDNQTCAVLESYAAACEEIGVSLGDWRYGTICGSTNSATTVTPDLTAPSTTVTYPPSPDPTASAAASTTRSSTPEPATSSTADHPDECSGNLNCSFDDDFCNWKQSSSDNMDWIRLKGPTPSDSTGPSYDHTTGDGFYIYIDGRDSLSGDVALLLSPQCNISRTHCFRFWYHMYGDAEMMELKVYVLTDEGVELVSILAGNAGDRWHLEEVLILNTGNIQIIIEGVRGENDRSDIAIDDVSFVPGYCINSIISTTARTREPTPASTSYPATSGPTALPPHSTNVPTPAPSTTTATYPPGLGSTTLSSIITKEPTTGPSTTSKYPTPPNTSTADSTSGPSTATGTPTTLTAATSVITGPTALPPHSTNVPTPAPSTTTATYPPSLGSTISNPTGTLGTTKASSTTTTIYLPSPDSTRTFPTIQSSTTSSPVTLPSAGSCVVQGDPHYNTFDHQVHHFMGTCTYTLSKLCHTDAHLTDFNVEAANEHRGGNTKVSYVTYVNVDVHGYRITLGKNRHVKVDGESVTLPISLSPGVNIFLSGRNVLVTTAFDLSVQFDGNHKVVVTLPGNYSRKVCGICGNFNGNAADDFLNPDGELEPDSASLGNSWQVGNDTRCSPGTDHTPDCTDDEKDTIVSNSFCGIITDTNGPFRHCHNVIDPTAYFNNCVYDLCVLHLDPDSLCDSLQSYVDSCQSHGVTVASWRNDTFCPLQCPPNSHYEQCGTGCPATCVNPGSPSSCTRPCAEGCVCDPGHVLYDNTCVQSNQCGCWKDDKHYPVGSEFWTDDTCSSKCTCPSAGGSLVCNSASCPSNQYCGISNGVPGCYFDTYGFCRVHNDPHYDTFDRQNHHFMGLCTYTLAKLCANSSSLPYFNIEAKNEHRGNPSVSFVEKVFVDVYGQKVQIVRNEQNRVLVNQIWTTLPVTLLGGAVKVSWTGKYVSLDTDFKLRVSYDTDSSVEVKVHSTFSKQTCGICGNFNNRKQDDYMMPNGQQAQNSDELGHSWIVDDGDPLCNTDDSEPMPLPPCSPEKEDLYKNDTFCGLLTSKDGPFHMCHSVINPEGFFDSCVFDLCALDGDVGILCSLLAAYADTCQKQGVTLNWRDSTLCEPKCPLNSHYNACMTACPITCLEPLAPENCSNPCSEGCECDEGYVISGGTCVSKSHCGCWYNNTYYDEGESFLEDNCENRCECKGSNTMVCTAVSCAADEICKVQSGTLGCYPLSTAVCHIYGDPHYNTFDGRLHHFQGSCNYTVTETCGNTSDSFIVTTRNEHRGSPSWTAINSVALTVGGVHILLGKNNIVSINNASVTLPANVSDIQITHSGRYVIVTTDFGLQLQFNGDHELFVRVKENYKGTLCGLCGNYNDNQQDDFMQPNGTVVSDVNDFGTSWRVPDNGWPCESAPPPPTCSPSLQQEAEDKCRILKLVNSPFRPCHIYINPHQYFESCIFDHCATGGNDNQTCAVLESYAAACEEIGVSLGDWRYGTICGSTNSTTTVTPDLTAPSTTVTYPPSPDPTASSAASTTRSSTPEPATSSTADHPDECSGNLNCSFDDDFCNWKQSSSDTMDWIRLKGPTPSDSTGPSYDHTTGDGSYIYIDGRHSQHGDVALLLSPQCRTQDAVLRSRTHCFRFWYHMYGDAEMMELKVYALTDEGVELVTILAGNAGDRWHLEEVLILNTGNIQIIIEGVRGENDRSDIAIDDVSFVPGYCINSIISTTALTREPTPASTSYPATSGPTALPPHSTNVPTPAPSTTTATYPPGSGSTTLSSIITKEPTTGPSTTSKYPTTPNTSIADSTSGPSTATGTPTTLTAATSVITDTSTADSTSGPSTATGTPTTLTAATSVITGSTTLSSIITKEPTTGPSTTSKYPTTPNTSTADSTSGPSTATGTPTTLTAATSVITGSTTLSSIITKEPTTGPSTTSKYPTTPNTSTADSTSGPSTATGTPTTLTAATSVITGSTISNPTDTLGTTKASSTTTTIYPPSPDSTRTFPTIQSSTTSSPVTLPSAGSCVVQGDPHYNTFDHQVHHFMGTCTYTLSKLCDTDAHLTDFNVEAANEHRGGNTKVSYVTYVNVDVHGYRITLGKNRHVKVDGESVTLPISLSPGVNIFLSGLNVLVTTAFDLSVQFDGNHKVVVTLPGNYSRKVCGICGNFNGNAADDFLNPDGELEPDSASLGNSWQVGNDTRCSPGTDHTPDCTDDEKDTIVSNSFCGIITDTNGPFRHCHNVIDPTAYFNNCVYDLCVLHLDPDSLCDSLQSYVDSCQSHGVTVAPWRNDTFCPLQCPPNSHYEQCGTGCPATCVNQGSPSSCTRPCAEGCVCDPGYVLYDNTCVQSNQCGCWKDDKHYPVGSEFWTDDTCSSKCTCPSAGGSLVCNSASCPSNQYCGISNGVPGCYFDTYGFCRVHNDPHYDTFDRQNHHFMGLCTYTLAKLCANSSSLPYFNIEAKNEHRGNPSVTFVEKVFVDVYGQKVQIVRNEQNRVLVNQIWTTLPVTLLGGAVKVSWTGKYVSLDTDFKLRVSYDTDSSVEVKVHSTFSKQTCGICGNFNNRKQDDYMMPNGQQAQNSDELGHSWIVDDGDPLCNTDDSEPMPLPPCSPEKEDLYKNDTFCGLLTSKDGPFHMCHSVINPEGFFDSCVFDLCALDGDVGILCSLLAAYADACQKQGVTLNWRNSTLCEPKCPLNSHYNACMTACPITCLEPLAPENCSNPCSEGCECDEGYVISGGTCVSKSHCGCWYNNTYYDEGESFLEENCENRCECKGSNTMVCTAVSCAADEICKVQSGTLGCYPLSTAICHIYGDPHYNTFDGRLHHFQGSCNYTVTETCGNTSDSFIVTTRNEHRGSPSWTAIHSVALTVGGVHILLGKNNIVSINNASVTLPANVSDIQITHSGRYVIVTTDFGLQLQFNGDHELFVRVKENYKGTLCGLCGNYNDNQQDDFMQPNGTLVSDVNDFGNSWRVPDNGWPCESAPPPPPTCSPSLQQEAEDKCRILKLVNSPFRPCHIYINPHQYFESCVFDHCATGGNDNQTCAVLESYAAACEEIGVSLGDWRYGTICAPATTSSPTVTATRTPSTQVISDPTTAAKTPGPTAGNAICSASGDPHYNTFDGAVHHYMGNCSYTLSKLCDESSNLPFFHVFTTNENRGSNTKVSYVQSVHIEVYSHEFTLLKNKKLNVNGRRTNPPVAAANRFIIQISGNYLLLETDFGLRVRFDGNHYADVFLPPQYQGRVCGLCGNYNDKSADDNIKPDGNSAADSTDLGDSWIVLHNDTLCGTEDLGTCDPVLEAEYSQNTVCGIITDPTGVFRDCHALVPPNNFFTSCIYDMCFTEGESLSLCYAAQSYAELCSNAGVCVEWRSPTFCPISCPGGSHYQSCGTGCPATCYSPTARTLCPASRVEGCFCDEGHLLSGDRCVPESDCGCIDENNNFYLLGESWFTYGNCSQRCTCNRNNIITCAAWDCGVREKCGLQDGVLGCHSSDRAACHVSGDPHYFTFDKVMHTFMGTCTYTLVKVCDDKSVIPVTISGNNEDRGQRWATYLKEVYIDIYGVRITLQKSKITLVDKERINTPWVGRLKGISIGTVGIYTVVETDFGMTVKFDGDHHLEIILPDSYYNKVCGMCGNYNGDQDDEFLMPNALQASNVTHFGNSWKSESDSDSRCLADMREDLDPPCTAAQRPVIQNQCNLLLSDTFRTCHHLIKPELFIQSCVYDMCRYDGMLSTLCAITQAYADACKTQGVNIIWRSATLCPLPCPTNSRYTDCASLCPPTCNDIFAPAVCDKPVQCMEGCVCNKGYVLSDDKCVPLSDCGCRDSKDNYYKVDESWITPHCTQKCQCKKGNSLKCKPYGCDSGICVLNNKGNYKCKPTGYAKCSVTGDPHYRTFDGLVHHFQGKDTYIVAQTPSDISDVLQPFKIEGRNEAMNSYSRFSLLKEIRVEVYNHTILFKRKKALVLDGVKAELPDRPHEGIYIYQRPTRTFMETDFGLSVSFDGVENADITLPNTYKNNVEGLCGNFDGKNKNDFTKPDGTQVKDVTTFGESWKVQKWKTSFRIRRETGVALNEDDLDDVILNTGDNLACSSSQLAFVNSTSFCGVLRDVEGPFKDCHQHVLPDISITNCLYDTCAAFQSRTLLCSNLEQYALSCQQEGGTVGGWREKTGCEMSCPPNSEYRDCMSACPASCSNMAAEADCESPCLEGCQCLPGYILSGFECVPYKECGGTYLNKYYKSGESFITDDCSQHCTCTNSSSITCNIFQCEKEEICTVANLTRGCYVSGPCLENPCENGGICIEDPSEMNSTSSMYCQCPETHTGMFCEAENKEYNDSTIYIVIGVLVGIFALCFVFALAAYFYFKSRKSRKRLIESTDSSGDSEENSVNETENALDLNIYEDSGAVINAAYDGDTSMNMCDETPTDFLTQF
ncbi:IgGFc-binding protein-like isoform X2 [Ascaphus truei]|uniref:IgGFc-binding protein-like isoform X2 n=1 Tax=Ascaphus truei TaxID=8439 RepID=UPI003F5AA874